MPLSELSDADLSEAIARKQRQQAISSMTDAELSKAISAARARQDAEVEAARTRVAEDRPSGVLGAIEEVGKTYDAYSGSASTRAAIGAIQHGEGLIEAVRRAKEVYGEKDLPEGVRAPTGKEIAEKAGFSKDRTLFTLPVIGDVSPAGLTGLAVDLAADPVNVVGGSIIKAGGKVLGKGAELAGKAADVVLAPVKNIAESRAVKGILSSGKSVFEYALDPKIADDWGVLAESAAKNGIDPEILPESFKYGRRSLINSLARRDREISDAASETYSNAYREVQGALQNQVAKVGNGALPTAVDGGEALKAGYEKAWSKLFQDNELTYNKLIEQNPDLSIKGQSLDSLKDHLHSLTDFAEEQVKEGLTNTAKAQGAALLQAVDRLVKKGKIDELGKIDDLGGKIYSGEISASDALNLADKLTKKSIDSIEEIPLKKIVSAFRDIRKEAFPKNKNEISLDPQDVEKFRDLYHAIIKSVGSSVEENLPNGLEVASRLRESNLNISNFLKDREIVEKVLGNPSLGAETIFKSLVMRGDTRKIEALKKVISPDEMQTVKAAAFQNLIDGARNTDDWVGFAKIRNQLRDKRAAFTELFTPQEANGFAEVVRLGDRFGEFPLSTSGTGPSLELSTKGVGRAVVNASTDRMALERLKARADTRAARMSQGGAGVLTPEESSSVIMNTIRAMRNPIGETVITPADIGIRSAQEKTIQDQNRRKKK
jgi:hypothetical protein